MWLKWVLQGLLITFTKDRKLIRAITTSMLIGMSNKTAKIVTIIHRKTRRKTSQIRKKLLVQMKKNLLLQKEWLQMMSQIGMMWRLLREWMGVRSWSLKIWTSWRTRQNLWFKERASLSRLGSRISVTLFRIIFKLWKRRNIICNRSEATRCQTIEFLRPTKQINEQIMSTIKPTFTRWLPTVQSPLHLNYLPSHQTSILGRDRSKIILVQVPLITPQATNTPNFLIHSSLEPPFLQPINLQMWWGEIRGKISANLASRHNMRWCPHLNSKAVNLSSLDRKRRPKPTSSLSSLDLRIVEALQRTSQDRP